MFKRKKNNGTHMLPNTHRHKHTYNLYRMRNRQLDNKVWEKNLQNNKKTHQSFINDNHFSVDAAKFN